jgi:hypothetical protein
MRLACRDKLTANVEIEYGEPSRRVWWVSDRCFFPKSILHYHPDTHRLPRKICNQTQSIVRCVVKPFDRFRCTFEYQYGGEHLSLPRAKQATRSVDYQGLLSSAPENSKTARALSVGQPVFFTRAGKRRCLSTLDAPCHHAVSDGLKTKLTYGVVDQRWNLMIKLVIDLLKKADHVLSSVVVGAAIMRSRSAWSLETYVLLEWGAIGDMCLRASDTTKILTSR